MNNHIIQSYWYSNFFAFNLPDPFQTIVTCFIADRQSEVKDVQKS